MKPQILFTIWILFLTINISGQEKWVNYTNKNNIKCIAIEGSKVWIGTNAGLVCRDTSGTLIAEYTTADGLLDNEINAISIDSKGNKWLGAMTGLCKFDNNQFTSFTTQNSGLIYNNVKAIKFTDNDTMWIGTFGGGVCKFDGTNWTSYNKSNSGLSGNEISSIEIDSQKSIWFVTRYAGACKFDGTKWTTYNSVNSGLPAAQIYSIAADKKNNIWIGTSQGVSKFNGSTWVNYHTWDVALPSSVIFSIFIDANDNKWFGTGKGLCKFDNSVWTTFNTTNSGIISNNIVFTTMDSAKNIWIGTDAGLSKLSNNKWNTFKTTNCLTSNSIKCLEIDKSGNKWVGTYGSGVNKFDGVNWINYNTANSGICDNYIKSVTIDKKGNIWFGGNFKGICKFDGTNWSQYNAANSGLSSNKISCIQVDANEIVWIGTEDKGVFMFDGKIWTNYNISNSGLANNFIHTIFIDPWGIKWFGTESGLSRFDDLTWKLYTTGNSGLSADVVNTINMDQSGALWFGGSYGSISKFDGIVWTKYNSDVSGISNYIISMTIDSMGNKWIGTSSEGMIKFDGHTWKQYYSHNSALLGDHVYAINIDPAGKKWFSTNGGLSKLDDGGPGPLNLNSLIQISGSVYNDLNNNGVRDTGEPLLSDKFVKFTNDSSIAVTQTNGSFSVLKKPGIYNIKFVPAQSWQLTSDSMITVEINDTTKKISDIDFGIKMLNHIHDVSVDITGGASRVGFDVKYWLTFKNEGTETKNGNVILELDSLISFVSSNPAPVIQEKNKLTWNYSNLLSLEQRAISLIVKMPDFNHFGDTLITKATINPIIGDTITANNISTFQQFLIGSYDPNDKLVETESDKTGKTFINEPLTYTIRFQNVGTDTAFNICIKDTLSSNLNLSTFKLLSSSHKVRVDIKNKNVINFIFSNIKLPYKKKNELASNGLVKFSVCPFSNHGNAPIKNKAYIYFDYNPPVVTNEVSSVFPKDATPVLSITPQELNFASTVDSLNLAVTSNTQWSLTCHEPWICFDKAAGSNNSSIKVKASENLSILPRTAKITISATGLQSKTVTIIQKAAQPFISIKANYAYLPATQCDTFKVQISSNTTWNINCDQDWINLKSNSGSGNALITFKALENLNSYPRKANINVSSEGVASKTLSFTQKASGNILMVSVDSLEISSKANNVLGFSILSNTSWNISSDQSWLKINPASGSNSSFVNFTCEANPSTELRKANITVSAPGVMSKTVKVQQKAGTLSISKISDDEFKIYPNPVTEKLFISFHENIAAPLKISIINLGGETVYSSAIEKKSESIDLNSLNSGIYFMRIITSDNKILIKKVIKQ